MKCLREIYFGIVFFLLVLGWLLNIYAFICSDFTSPYKSEIIRGISIVVSPIGSVIGYMDIGDESD